MALGTWIWLTAGIALMLLELALPGFVVIFLGMGAVGVAGLVELGVLESTSASLVTWVITSLVLLLALRRFGTRLFPGDVSKDDYDEDEEAFGVVVDVLETVTADPQQGRIKFRGTTWSAACLDGQIESGQKAKIIFRKDMAWIVEPYDSPMLEEEIL